VHAVKLLRRCVCVSVREIQSAPESVQYKALLANKNHPLNTLALLLVHQTILPIDQSYNPKTIIKEIQKKTKKLKDSH